MKQDLFKRHRFPREIIEYAVYLKLRFSLSYRDVREILSHKFVYVDPSTINRWVLKFAPLLEKEFRKKKRIVGKSWRMDEMFIKVKGKWCYLYRAVDKAGNTIDFLLSERNNHRAAWRYLKKAVKRQGLPLKATIDGSRANRKGVQKFAEETKADIEIRTSKYLNNRVESDHRFIRRIIRPMLGFKSFSSACKTLAGIEVVHMIRKGQLRTQGYSVNRTFQQFQELFVSI